MAITLDLSLVREQCRVDDEVSDQLLQSYVDAGLSHVQMHCDRTLVEGEPAGPEQMKLTADVQQAVLLLVGHWAANREAVVTGTISTAVDLGVQSLLWYRKRF